MSFAIWYACYTLLNNSHKTEESHTSVQQTYVHDEPIKGKKLTIKKLRKKFKNSNRGGSCL